MPRLGLRRADGRLGYERPCSPRPCSSAGVHAGDAPERARPQGGASRDRRHLASQCGGSTTGQPAALRRREMYLASRSDRAGLPGAIGEGPLHEDTRVENEPRSGRPFARSPWMRPGSRAPSVDQAGAHSRWRAVAASRRRASTASRRAARRRHVSLAPAKVRSSAFSRVSGTLEVYRRHRDLPLLRRSTAPRPSPRARPCQVARRLRGGPRMCAPRRADVADGVRDAAVDADRVRGRDEPGAPIGPGGPVSVLAMRLTRMAAQTAPSPVRAMKPKGVPVIDQAAVSARSSRRRRHPDDRRLPEGREADDGVSRPCGLGSRP